MKMQALLRRLREARKAATMEHAGFDDLGGSTLVRFCPNPIAASLPRTDPENETEYIKQRTALYRQSWIIGPIDEAIALVEAEQSRRRVKP